MHIYCNHQGLCTDRDIKCDDCNNNIRHSYFEPMEDKITDPTCDVCGKVCKSAFGLQAHKRSHK